MGSALQVLPANALCDSQPTLPHQLERLVKQRIQLFVAHGVAVGLSRTDIITLGGPYFVEVAPSGNQFAACSSARRFTQTAQPLQSQPQLVVPNLKARVHAEGRRSNGSAAA